MYFFMMKMGFSFLAQLFRYFVSRYKFPEKYYLNIILAGTGISRKVSYSVWR